MKLRGTHSTVNASERGYEIDTFLPATARASTATATRTSRPSAGGVTMGNVWEMITAATVAPAGNAVPYGSVARLLLPHRANRMVTFEQLARYIGITGD
jgi:hypothetical protein